MAKTISLREIRIDPANLIVFFALDLDVFLFGVVLGPRQIYSLSGKSIEKLVRSIEN